MIYLYILIVILQIIEIYLNFELINNFFIRNID